jgi:hypothetical protein
MKNFILGIAYFLLAHFVTWFQLNGQFLWGWFQKNTLILAIFGIPISYLYIWETKHTTQYFDGVMWPVRFIGFGCGIVIYAVLVGMFFKEGINLKTLISLLLAILLVFIQIFWK